MEELDLALEAMPNPVVRHAHILVRIEEVREQFDELCLLRARTVQEISEVYGPSKAALLLGISRMTLYRIVGQIPEVRQTRSATRIDVATRVATILGEAAAVAAAAASHSDEDGGEEDDE
jgi:hypothetical protein